MGMGKTIQTIALLLSDKQKPNLVIAPTVAIMQWREEILKHTDNALTVHVFHGSNRTKKQSDLEKFDVVLSTCKLYAWLGGCDMGTNGYGRRYHGVSI